MIKRKNGLIEIHHTDAEWKLIAETIHAIDPKLRNDFLAAMDGVILGNGSLTNYMRAGDLELKLHYVSPGPTAGTYQRPANPSRGKLKF